MNRNGYEWRNCKGNLLIELVVAIGVSAIIFTAACQAFSQVHQMSKGTQNQALAAHIAQELIDNARNQRFSELQKEVGITRTLVVNGTGQAPASTINPRPLLLDLSNLQYKNYSLQGSTVSGNAFRGTVQQTITDLGQGMLRISVSVSWPAENPGTNRSLQLNTVLSQYGIHN